MCTKRSRESLDSPEEREWCCISHTFHRVALENHNKIAVIESSPTAQFRNQSLPYQGDRCFTFSQLLDAVDSLSCRLRSILAGAHDPFMMNPTGQSGFGFLFLANEICLDTLQRKKMHLLFYRATWVIHSAFIGFHTLLMACLSFVGSD